MIIRKPPVRLKPLTGPKARPPNSIVPALVAFIIIAAVAGTAFYFRESKVAYQPAGFQQPAPKSDSIAAKREVQRAAWREWWINGGPATPDAQAYTPTAGEVAEADRTRAARRSVSADARISDLNQQNYFGAINDAGRTRSNADALNGGGGGNQVGPRGGTYHYNSNGNKAYSRK